MQKITVPAKKTWTPPTIIAIQPSRDAQTGSLALVETLNILGNVTS